MIARFLYFLLIGWWFGGLVALVGYLLCGTMVFLPFGVVLLNRLPTFIFLREVGEECPEGYDHRHYPEEIPFLLRIIWFFVIGWTLGLTILAVGYVFVLTIVGIPVGIYLLNRVPKAMTLSMHYG